MRPDVTDRFAVLNLNDPDPMTGLSEAPRAPDLLFYALAGLPAHDPVESLVEGVRVELLALADVLSESAVSVLLRTYARRLEVAERLLSRCDGREPMPPEDPPEVPEVEEPTPPSGSGFDPDEETLDTGPESGGDHGR